MKPINKFRAMPIEDCGEPLIEIPQNIFLVINPHPYVKAHAPYNGASPWMLRESVVERLKKAQLNLHKIQPSWNFLITDAYRPNSAHNFMVECAFRKAAKEKGLTYPLSAENRHTLETTVYRLWARPCDDPLQPVPHSTGGALDITFADEYGLKVYMGSSIDEEKGADPDYFKDINPRIHARRQLLGDLMAEQGFRRANDEWWHFSFGDQFWAYYQKEAGRPDAAAIYGRADLLPQFNS